MDLGLKDKVALVIGASEGMGKASAISMAKEGAKVAVVARSTDKIEASAEDIRQYGTEVLPISADMMDADQAVRLVREAHKHFGGLDILVNAIGDCVSEEGFCDYDDKNWSYHFESVLMTTVRACREVLPLMKSAGGGSIINIVSQSTQRYYDKMVSYAAMKASVAHITKEMAKEFATSGIRVNAIRAGWILSESQRRAIDELKPAGMSDDDYFQEMLKYWHDVSWSERFGTLDEIGDTVAFLASERASYINGAWLQVDGGSI